MFRLLISCILGFMLLCVTYARLEREVRWFEQYGNWDYILIGTWFVAFVGLVGLFDHEAEERGWIVHHMWWSDGDR